MAWSFTPGGQGGGGEVSPGVGSTGFTSTQFVVGNSSGQLVSSTMFGIDGTTVVITGGARVGSSASTARFSLPSTLNISTSIGTTGAAAAPPATPEVYIKILAPNAAGTLTTLYIPAYPSTA